MISDKIVKPKNLVVGQRLKHNGKSPHLREVEGIPV
jgi:hypothetical protein